MGQAGGSESIRKDAFPIATSTASVGRVKRLLKVSDQMQPELERDQSFASMVARVGKLNVDAVPLGFALIAAASRSARKSGYCSAQVAALSMSCAVDPVGRGPIEQAHPG